MLRAKLMPSDARTNSIDSITRQRIRSALRKVWQWSDPRRAALAKQRVSKGRYLCEACGGLFGPKMVQVDHIEPVGSFPGSRRDNGSATWEGVINRMFCPVEGLRVLCKPCHKAVS